MKKRNQPYSTQWTLRKPWQQMKARKRQKPQWMIICWVNQTKEEEITSRTFYRRYANKYLTVGNRPMTPNWLSLLSNVTKIWSSMLKRLAGASNTTKQVIDVPRHRLRVFAFKIQCDRNQPQCCRHTQTIWEQPEMQSLLIRQRSSYLWRTHHHPTDMEYHLHEGLRWQ